jgi:hypothetical protein
MAPGLDTQPFGHVVSEIRIDPGKAQLSVIRVVKH